MRWREGTSPEEVTPSDVNVRSRVYEYGGGDYAVRSGLLVHVDAAAPGIAVLDLLGRGRGGVRLGAGEALRHADFALSPDGRWLAAVEEDHARAAEPANRLVVFSLVTGERRIVDERHDFVAAPRFAPDGRRLAWLAWDHPNMPWDGTLLLVAEISQGRLAGPPRCVAGGSGESLVQPAFSPQGHLTWASDRSGWWNLWQERESGPAALWPEAAEYAGPAWTLGPSSWGFVAERALLCAVRSEGRDALVLLDLAEGRREELALGVSAVAGLDVAGDRAVLVAAGPAAPLSVCVLDLAARRLRELRRASSLELDPAFVAAPEPVQLASANGRRIPAFLYRPRNPGFEGSPGERPPALVRAHGGPTAACLPVFDPVVQHWTTRGLALLDVNYTGSHGFGRAHRDGLRGAWGVADVEDCVAGARFLGEGGLADPARLAIAGGSAGGFTALCALAFHDVFAAGLVRYGVADLEALARDTHKFESRYLEGLIGAWPARSDLYRERSPLHHAARIGRPVLFLQGLDDRVVPPAQTQSMAEALARRGVPHAVVTFPGEGHGFRRADTLRRMLETELWFLGQVFGFPVEVVPAGARLVGAPGGGTLAAP
jgi:dipeptidyl aminopeptidase/acylaminoacyl peptidase